MKNLINICKMLPILLLVLGSCKEKSTDPVNTELSINDLTNYYLVVENKAGDKRLGVISFIAEGNTVKASAHFQGALRVHEATLENAVFRFDYNSNGASVYTFTFRKDASGNLQLQSQDLTASGVAGQLSQAVLVKKSDALPIMNKTFWVESVGFKIEMDGNQPVLQWIDGKRYASYTLENYGFKTNQDEYMGVVVPNWNFNGKNLPGMLVEVGDQVVMGISK